MRPWEPDPPLIPQSEAGMHAMALLLPCCCCSALRACLAFPAWPSALLLGFEFSKLQMFGSTVGWNRVAVILLFLLHLLACLVLFSSLLYSYWKYFLTFYPAAGAVPKINVINFTDSHKWSRLDTHTHTSEKWACADISETCLQSFKRAW